MNSIRKHRSKEGDPIPPLRKKLMLLDANKVNEIEKQVKIMIETIVLQASTSHMEQGGEAA